jgi:hypothetical protein
MPRLAIILVAFSLVIISGVGQGLLTDRWGFSAEPQASAAKLSLIPLALGDWQGQDLEMDPREFSRASIAGYVMRRYVHRLTGTELQVLLVCGRPGHVAVHSPEVCFQGEGYVFEGEKQSYSLRPSSNQADDFWVANCIKERGEPDQLRIFWSFSSAGTWRAPKDPRLDFAREPALFKLYVVRHLAKLGDSLDDDPSVEFLRVFLPKVQQCLFVKS